MDKTVPENALTFAASEVLTEANAEGSKTVKVRMLARSPQPIQHWYWGSIVHDLSGAKIKSKIPIDYAHDDSSVIGYLNKSEIDSDGLWLSGALVPYGDDKGAEVVYKMGLGVPYEASINFGGDGIRIEELQAGTKTIVNGFEFSGPGVVVREWPLRGVAICPYGADANTESSLLSEKSKEVKVRIDQMEDTEEVVEPVEAGTETDSEAPAVVVVVEELESEAKPAEDKNADAKAELAQYVAEFGHADGAAYFLGGKSIADARLEQIAKLKAENAELRKTVAKMPTGSQPVAFSGCADQKPKPRTLAEAIQNRKG